jgi:hypothetical protein
MTAVVFETPGLIDMRAFTIMGAHAKPNSTNPIGFFGTGLKYAIAVLVRLGCEPVVFIGLDKLTFTGNKGQFRGTPLETIRMSVHKAGNKRPTNYELPFTTHYGAKWEPWMAFRELESNTRDEGGKTYLFDASDDYPEMRGIEGITRIVVDQADFLAAAEKIDEIFLPRGARKGNLLEAFEGESDHIYYRTMRAKDIQKPTLYTYNILEQMELTEDRSLKYDYYIKNVLARWVLTEATEEQVTAILKAGKDYFEHKLEFPGHVKPSAAFESVMKSKTRGLSRESWGYFGSYVGRAVAVVKSKVWEMFTAYPKPWKLDEDAVVDAEGTEICMRPPGMDEEEWELLGAKIIRLLRAGLTVEEPGNGVTNVRSDSEED